MAGEEVGNSATGWVGVHLSGTKKRRNLSITLSSTFTATLTSLFVERDAPPDTAIEQRLERIESKLDALLK